MLTVVDVRRIFGPPVIRVMLNWDYLEQVRPTISLRAITSSAEVAGLFTTWYLNEDKTAEVDIGNAVAAPLRVQDAASRLHALSPGRRKSIINGGHPSADFALAVPLYQLPGGECLVLDGNHRLTQAIYRGESVRALGVIIEGPIDQKLLPDLRFWS